MAILLPQSDQILMRLGSNKARKPSCPVNYSNKLLLFQINRPASRSLAFQIIDRFEGGHSFS